MSSIAVLSMRRSVVKPVGGGHLALGANAEQGSGVVSDDDVTAIIEALFDIRTELRRIVVLLEEDDGEQGNEEADS